MYHHCQQQRIGTCIKRKHKKQRICEFYLTRHTHSLNKEFQIINPLNNPNFKRVRHGRHKSKLRIGRQNNGTFVHGTRSSSIAIGKALLLATNVSKFPLASKYNHFTKIVKQFQSRLTEIKTSNQQRNGSSNGNIAKALLNAYILENVALYGALCNGLRFFNNFCRKHPFIAGAFCVTLTGMVADAFSQVSLENKSIFDVNMKRVCQFGTYCFLTHGFVGYFLVNKLYFRMFPGYSIKQTMKKVAFEELIYLPLFYFPFFYFVKELFDLSEQSSLATSMSVENTKPSQTHTNNSDLIKDLWTRAMLKYKENCVEDIVASWCVWTPVQSITFGVVPMHLRVPWITLVSFLWFCGLSYFRAGDDNEMITEETKEDVPGDIMSYNEKRLQAIAMSSRNAPVAM